MSWLLEVIFSQNQILAYIYYMYSDEILRCKPASREVVEEVRGESLRPPTRVQRHPAQKSKNTDTKALREPIEGIAASLHRFIAAILPIIFA